MLHPTHQTHPPLQPYFSPQGMESTKELIVQGKQWMSFSRWALHLEEGTDTLPRVGELARGGSCCHTGDP